MFSERPNRKSGKKSTLYRRSNCVCFVNVSVSFPKRISFFFVEIDTHE